MAPESELHVIFGTGPVGKWTMRELVRLGRRVRMVNRGGQAEGVPAEVEVVQGDAYDPAVARELTRGAAAVYQCAQPAYHDWEAKFPALQASILDGAAANGGKLILAENLYMYGDPGGRPLTEDSPHAAHTRKGRVRGRLAEAAMAAHRSGKVRVAAGRASDFFGPDDPVTGRLIFRPALAGKRVSVMGRLDVPHTFSYAPDFGKALATLGTREEALGQAWHIPSPPPVTQAELIDMLAEEVGRPVKVLSGNALILRALGLFNPTVGELVEMLYEWTAPFVMDSGKYARAFGDHATPLRQALRETVAWNRERAASPAAKAP
jgi:nucleoside-diphosphate-sugar epimerase